MPVSYICRTRTINARIDDIVEAYGEEIFSEISAIYFVCFTSSRSHFYVKLINQLSLQEKKSMSEILPFFKSGTREDRLVFVPLLLSLLRSRSKYSTKDLLEDAVFIIYLVYFLGFNGNINEFNEGRRRERKTIAFSTSSFQKSFSTVKRLKFREASKINNKISRPHKYISSQSESMKHFKKQLIDSSAKFRTKYKNHEKVEKKLIKMALKQLKGT